MCGIVGFVSPTETISREMLQLMRDSLVHRGPDDAGIELLNSDRSSALPSVGLAHRRLSIIDLSSAGQQPLSNEDRSVWITYNGECYNFQSLIGDLRDSGHVFKSKTDTEVLVHGYEQWGIEGLLQKVNGMFAFGIWDQRKGELLLARDRVGKKPLYYTITRQGTLVFASEIKALVAGGFVDQNDIDANALVQFWTYGYSTGAQTMFRGVYRLMPGHYGVFKDSKLVQKEYWDVRFDSRNEGRGLDDLSEELEEILLDAIRLRLISDVPIGVFLSGGIDSSLITALAAKVTGRNVNSYSIGFADKNFDETGFAGDVANHLGIENSVLRVDEDLQHAFPAIALHFDELFGDSSAIPTYFVAKLARRHVTVALTGDAGDELFGGYDAYAKALSIWGTWQQKKRYKKRIFTMQWLVDFLKLGFVTGNDRLSALERIMPLGDLKKVFTEELFKKITFQEIFRSREHWYARVQDVDLLSQLQYVNLKTYLVDDILVKVDRMSMAHALECRSPFLDYRVIEFASRLGFQHKISRDGTGKYILRRLLQRYLPNSLIDRPKMGFSIPWSQWCRGPLGREIVSKWKEMDSPYFKREGASFLFPENKLGWPARQWNAYCTVNFFSRNE